MNYYDIKEIISGVGQRIDYFVYYIDDMFKISQAKTKEELEEIRKNYLTHYKDEYEYAIKRKLSQLEKEEKEKNEREIAYETCELVSGEYYYLYLSETEQLTVRAKNINCNNNVEIYAKVPVIAYYDGKALIDILSGMTYRFTLNPLTAIQNGINFLVDHAVRLNRDDLYKEARNIHELSPEEREKFREELQKTRRKDDLVLLKKQVTE